MVNNAGIFQPRSLMETDTELFERHTRVNQLGCFLGMKTVVPLMEQSGGGSIVNISLGSADPQARSHTVPPNGLYGA
jgi:3alpha(or 20beta)-hydroxysteroid dehydrogenase